MPSLAIVFGTYNRFEHLHKAVKSVRAAVGAIPYQMIIIDGGSTDGSRQWLSAQDDVVLIGQQKPLTGAVRAFNLGFAYAVDHNFDYVCHLNDDAEIITPNGLEDAIKIFQINPKVGAIAFAFDLNGEWHHDYVNGKPYTNFGILKREAGIAAAKAQGDPSGRNWWNPIYKTYGADSELGCWLWKLGWEVMTVDNIRVHDIQAMDDLRTNNGAADPEREDSKIFWRRWKEETFANASGPKPIAAPIVTPTITALPSMDAHVLITGSTGFLGSHLIENLRIGNPTLKIAAPIKKQVDLTDLAQTIEFFKATKPKLVYHLAAKVGGIGANTKQPATFFEENMLMGINVLKAAREVGVQKVVLVGTVCSYPKFTDPPFKERDLWTGFPDESNAPYGIAKKALSVLGDGYKKQFGLNVVTAILANLFGPRDSFDLTTSHVIPAIIRKFVDAQTNNQSSVTLWGDGTPTREFLYVDDAITALKLVAEKHNDGSPINIGTGHEISIQDVASLIAQIVGYTGAIVWDKTKPNGQPRRALDTTMAKNVLGFKPTTILHDGLVKTVSWFTTNRNRLNLK